MFDPRPETVEQRRQKQNAHAQNMLSLIAQLGSYSRDPLPKYNYGGQALQLGNDISKNFAATLLMASGGGGVSGNKRTAALQRRLKRP